MEGRYRNNFQAAILFDGRTPLSIDRAAQRIRLFCEMIGLPTRLGVHSETQAMILGPGEFQLHVEWIDAPAKREVFAPALGSFFNSMLAEDATQRIDRHGSHVLVSVQHGVLGGVADNAELQGFLDKIGMFKRGHSLEDFRLRVRAMMTAVKAFAEQDVPSLVHLTQSDILFTSDKLGLFCEDEEALTPTVHPLLYKQASEVEGAPPMLGFTTFGAADHFGYEIEVTPAPVPWLEQFNSALVLIRVATMKNGYIIPDGNTFGPEDGSTSYRVQHLEAGANGARSPRIRISLIYSKPHGYYAPDYEPRQTVPGGAAGAAAMIGNATPEAREAIRELRKREETAHAAGIGFSVSVAKPANPQPRAPGGGRIVPFGRRGLT